MNIIFNGDNQTYLPTLKDESVELCITSPPYKDEDGYTDSLMGNTFKQIYRILSPNCLFFLNFGHLAEDKFRPFHVCKIAMDCGFKLNETITWVKNHYRPIQGDKRLNNLSEFIFLLYKGSMPDIDRLSIGIPYKDKNNAKRFAKGRDLKCRGNVWYINYETIQDSKEKLHNDRFPLELPETCIKLAGIAGTGLVVLDPFAGSGTTCVAAKRLGCEYIGIEKDIVHFQTCEDRLNESKPEFVRFSNLTIEEGPVVIDSRAVAGIKI